MVVFDDVLVACLNDSGIYTLRGMTQFIAILIRTFLKSRKHFTIWFYTTDISSMTAFELSEG